VVEEAAIIARYRAKRRSSGLETPPASTNLAALLAHDPSIRERNGQPTQPRRNDPMMKKLLAVLLSVAVAAPLVSHAQDSAGLTDLQQLRTAAQTDKKALVGSTLQLSDAEAKKFWPIYDDYQRSRDASDRQRVRAIEGVIATDKPISDAYARNLARDLTAADEAEVKARRAMQNKLMRALPAKKAARYLQLESKLRAIQAYDIASSMPLIK
jgi:hypothetical protein